MLLLTLTATFLRGHAVETAEARLRGRRRRTVVFLALAHADFGTVVWNDMVDIAPERLYEDGVPLAERPAGSSPAGAWLPVPARSSSTSAGGMAGTGEFS